MLGLGLTDKQLLLYALIWNTSKNGSGLFKGTAPYIAEWLGCTDRNVKKIVRQLEDRGLIAHEVIRTVKKTYTIFWAIDPDKAKAPEKGNKAKIDWIGRTPKFPTEKDHKFPTGREPEFPTDKVSIYSQDSNTKKNTRVKNTRIKRDDAQKSMVVFNPPTIQEVQEYARAQGFADPAGFAEYYVAYQTEAGWMTGKGSKRHPIDNWKLNVIAWGRYRKNEIFNEGQAAPERRTRQLTAEEIAKYFPGV